MKDRIEPFKNNISFTNLTAKEQNFIEIKANKHLLTFQEIKILIDIGCDLKTWNEGTLKDYWFEKPDSNLKGKQLKQEILNDINNKWQYLKSEQKDYSSFPKYIRENQPLNYIETDNNDTMLGKCPVASEKTRCCNLLTLDVVNNCGFDCTYCSIQSFFDNNRVYFNKNLKEKLKTIKLDPKKKYHIGTGQSSDSLMWGNRMGILDDLKEFAGNNSNIILELKTKSKNISWFMENDIPENIIITWSLNTNTIIEKEEHLTASLEERLHSAREIADKGIITGFHFHPMVYYKNWEKEYINIFNKIQNLFSPEEIALISFGTLTFIKPVIKKIRSRNIKSKILQMPLNDAGGKLSYPYHTKLEMFTKAYKSFSQIWKNKVFFYLCMENESLWKPVFGKAYNNNEEFEQQMIKSYFNKVYK